MTLEEFIASFPKDNFQELKEIPKGGGALIMKIGLTPAKVFALLEELYGAYNDLHKDALFIDHKNSWERYFQTSEGILRVYDHRGSVSIGYHKVTTPALQEKAAILKTLIEEGWGLCEINNRDQLQKNIEQRPIDNFIRTFFAVARLLQNAEKNGSHIESLILYATLIDAQLRYAIILLAQLENKNSAIDNELIFQQGKKFVTERKIFDIAKEKNIINEVEFIEISALYDFRNRAVHRYFISDFQYAELAPALERYKAVYELTGKTIENLEEAQIGENVGMITRATLEITDEKLLEFEKAAQLKIDSTKPIVKVPKRKHLFPKSAD